MPIEKSPTTDNISLRSRTHKYSPSPDYLLFALALDFLYFYFYFYFFAWPLELNLTPIISLAFWITHWIYPHCSDGPWLSLFDPPILCSLTRCCPHTSSVLGELWVGVGFMLVTSEFPAILVLWTNQYMKYFPPYPTLLISSAGLLYYSCIENLWIGFVSFILVFFNKWWVPILDRHWGYRDGQKWVPSLLPWAFSLNGRGKDHEAVHK